MKVLGEGWQYRTYDLGNGRVLKKYHSTLRSYWALLKFIFPFRTDKPWMILAFSREMKEKAIESTKVLKRHDIPREWLGNPKFLNELDFEQDKVEPLHEVFSRSSTGEIKYLIDDFVVFNLKLLKIEVIDKSFNITKNFGLSGDGQMVLIDLGELFDDTSVITHQLGSRAWSKSYVADCIEDKDARRYFLDQMDRHFSPREE